METGKKIVFLDIDGTLTMPGHIVPPESAREAVLRARENGHKVFLCSGRSRVLLRPLLKYGFDGYIGSAGGYICVGDEVIFDCPMEKSLSEEVMSVLKENGIYMTLECLDETYTDPCFVSYLKEHPGELDNSEILRWVEKRDSTLGIRPMEEYGGEPIYKIVIVVPAPENLEAAEKVLGDRFSLRIQNPEKGRMMNGELINRRFDKGRALIRVCEREGIPIKDSVAVGDSANDREMLETAGLSVCMENGSDDMKRLADMICPAVWDDGLYRAFEEIGLL